MTREDMKRLIRKKLIEPISLQLRQGANPDKLAWSVSLGVALGLFPIMGTTTALCAAAGAAFRLNHVAMQTVNYVVYGAHLALIPIFIRIGEKISGSSPMVIDLALMKAQFLSSPWSFFQNFGMAAWHGVLAWGILLPLPTWITAEILKRIFKKRRNSARN